MKFLIAFLMTVFLMSCKNGYVLDIEKFHFKGDHDIVFGQKGDVIIPGLPDTAFTIKKAANDGITWEMKTPLYVKINDTTLNTVNLDSVKEIRIGNYRLSKEKVSSCTEQFSEKKDKVRYVSLDAIFKRYYGDLHGLNIKSVFACDKSDNVIVILDSALSMLSNNDKIINWIKSGSRNGGTNDVRFFRTLQYYPVNITGKEDFFTIRDTAFIARVKPQFTSFGSEVSRLYFQRTDVDQAAAEGEWVVGFDRPFRVVLPKDLIAKSFDSVHKFVYVNQEQVGYLPGPQLYTENFSNGTIRQIGAIDKEYKFQPSSNSELRDYYFYSISFNFTIILNYLPLLLIYLAGILIFLYFFRKSETDVKFYEVSHAYAEFRNWKRLFIINYTVLFILLTVRIFIGYNLSFSYPYFTFANLNSNATAPLILFAVLVTYLMIWNMNFESVIDTKLRFIFAGILLAVLLCCFIINFHQILNSFRDIITNRRQAKSYNIGLFFSMIYSFVAWTSLIFFNGSRIVNRIFQIGIIILLAVICVLAFQKDNATSLIMLPWVLIVYLARFSRRKGIKKKLSDTKLFARNILISSMKLTLLGIPVLLIIFLRHDKGYFVTMILFIVSYFLLHGLYLKLFSKKNIEEKWRLIVGAGVSTVLIGVVLGFLIYKVVDVSSSYKPGAAERFKSRVTAMYSFDKMREFGYSETEEISQFFAIMAKYSMPADHNKFEQIHSSISSYQDPVVKNDLSTPFGFIYSSGRWWRVSLYSLIIVLLGLFAYNFKMVVVPTGIVGAKSNLQYVLTSYGIVRLFATCIVCGTGLYLLLSYFGLVPFTGRLIYGLGQDSFAEVVETIGWFSLMGLVGNMERE